MAGLTSVLDTSQLLALFDRVPDIVWRDRLLPEARFEYVSPSVFAVTGYTPAEHYADADLGRRIAHPDDMALLEETIRSPAAYPTVMLRWRHRGGTTFTTEHHLTVVRDGDGRAVAIEGVGRPVPSSDGDVRVQAGDVVLDLAAHRALVDDRVIDLTPAEHRILSLLMTADGPVSQRDLVVRLWGGDHPGGTRAVQVHVSNLRRKLERDPRSPRRLLTQRGRLPPRTTLRPVRRGGEAQDSLRSSTCAGHWCRRAPPPVTVGRQPAARVRPARANPSSPTSRESFT